MSKSEELRQLADKFSEGWHEGIKIDAMDVMLLSDAASELETVQAIQQAQQPATSVPVVVQHRKPVIGWKGETIGYTGWRDGKGLDGWPHRDLYDHPAPSEPKLIEIAISSGYFDVLPVKATIPMCKAGWGASGGGLTFQEIGHIYEEMYKARPLPDPAMLAAKETP